MIINDIADLVQFSPRHKPMPNDLRQMELQTLNGTDPDSIRGIERLWIYRLKNRMGEWENNQTEFFEWLNKQKISNLEG